MGLRLEGTNRIYSMMVSSQQAIKDQEQKDEVNGKTEQNNEKKVPVLTISLRPGKELGFICMSFCVIYLLCIRK